MYTSTNITYLFNKKTMMKTMNLFLTCCLALAGWGGTVMKAQTHFTPQVGDVVTTDNGKYVVKGSNLITNPSFDDGVTGWTAGDGSALSTDNFSVETTGGADGGAFLKALGVAGSSSVKSIKTGWGIETGKTYLFSCWALRTKSGMSSNTQYSRVFQSDSQTATTTQIGTLNYTADTWVQTQIVFTAEKTFCVANFGWLNSATSLDCFYLGEVELSNELAKEKLTALISDADSIYSHTTEGTDKGQFTAAVRSTFKNAIDAAKDVLTNATLQTEINDAVTTLKAAIAAYKSAENPPFKVGQKYVIVNRASGLYMTSAGSTGKAVTIAENVNSNAQIFIFEAAPDGAEASGYNLKDADGNYVYRSGSWDLFSGTTTLTAVNAIFNTVADGDYYQLKNMGSGSVLGTDATTAGAAVYSNKNGAGVDRFDWTIEPYSITKALEDQIAKAEALAAATSVGSAFGQVPQSAMDALNAAIAKAKTDLASVTTFDEVQAAATALSSAIDTFNASFNPLQAFDTSKTYAITHSGGNVLTVTASGNASITAPATDETTAATQAVTLVSVPNDSLTMVYRIKAAQQDVYLAMTGTYNTVWQAKADTVSALFQIVQLQGKNVGLKCLANGKFLGTDAASAGQFVYSDKAGKGNMLSYWTIDVQTIASTVDKTAFAATIKDAQTLQAAMVQGYKAGQYYLSDMNAFSAIVNKAMVDYKSLAEQTAVDAANTQLAADIAAYKAKAHAADVSIASYLADLVPIFQAECDAAVVGTSKGQYTAAAKQAYADAIAKAKNTASPTEATLDELLSARATFLASAANVDHDALTSAIAAANTSLKGAVAGDCSGQYPQSALDAYKAAIAAATAVNNDLSQTQTQVDAALATLTQAGQTFAAAAVVIDFSNLNAVIVSAKALIEKATPEKGTGPGTYPESAFTALQGEVDAASAMLTSKTVNQTSVNAEVQKLNNAMDTFEATRIPNDYSALKAALALADSLYTNTNPSAGDAAAVAAALADLKASIDKNTAALTSTSQTDINKATKIMLRDIALFRSLIATGIGNVALDGTAVTVGRGCLTVSAPSDKSVGVAVYTLGGVRVANVLARTVANVPLNKGAYIVVLTSETARQTVRVAVR